MTPQYYLYYSFLENQRKRAMYQYSLVQNAIAAIRQAALDGMNPDDPSLKDYWLLIDEFDHKLYESEIEQYRLTLEDDTEV